MAPRKKVTVMIIGNHSAGKSSFINWYIEEHVQRAGVAIETQGESIPPDKLWSMIYGPEWSILWSIVQGINNIV